GHGTQHMGRGGGVASSPRHRADEPQTQPGLKWRSSSIASGLVAPSAAGRFFNGCPRNDQPAHPCHTADVGAGRPAGRRRHGPGHGRRRHPARYRHRHPHQARPAAARRRLESPGEPARGAQARRRYPPGSDPFPDHRPHRAPAQQRAQPGSPGTDRETHCRNPGAARHRRAADVPARAGARRAGPHGRGDRPVHRDDRALPRIARALEQPGRAACAAGRPGPGARRFADGAARQPGLPGGTRQHGRYPAHDGAAHLSQGCERGRARHGCQGTRNRETAEGKPTSMISRYSPLHLLRLMACTFALAAVAPASAGAQPADQPTSTTSEGTKPMSTQPRVKLQTNQGEIVITLDAEKAPKTVENFLGYVKSGFYDGTVFHRVIDGFMIQGGGFEPGLKQKPTQAPIENEANNGLKNDKYTLAMAAPATRTRPPPSSSSTWPTTIS